MNSLETVRLLVSVSVIGLLALAGCDSDSPTDPGHENVPAVAQVFDRDTGALLAYTHGTGAGIHWDGGIPHLHVGEEIELDIVFLNDDGEEIAYGSEFEARARLADGSPTGVIQFANHGDHIDVEAIGEGEAYLVLMFWHRHADWGWETPPLEFEGDDH